MWSKKAQGLSVSFIIIIVLGLIVVGVMVYMLGSRVKMFGTSTSNCAEKRGDCVLPKDCDGAIIGAMNCPEVKKAKSNAKDFVCCVAFEDTNDEKK